jgi:hypothetical protein
MLPRASRMSAIVAIAVIACAIAGCDDKPSHSDQSSAPATTTVRPRAVVPGSTQPPGTMVAEQGVPASSEVGATGTAPAAASQPADGRTITSSDGAYRVTYRTQPLPIPMNEPFTLDVRISSADGTPLGGDVALEVDAVMPEHGHGMNVEPKTIRETGGRFTVTNLLFHMPGRWELHLDITREGVTSRAQDEIMLE